MKISRIITKNSCKICNGAVAFKFDAPLTKNILPLLVNEGFKPKDNFTKSGLLYAENETIIISGRFGSNIIQTQCKKKDCTATLNNFEAFLSKLE